MGAGGYISPSQDFRLGGLRGGGGGGGQKNCRKWCSNLTSRLSAWYEQ